MITSSYTHTFFNKQLRNFAIKRTLKALDDFPKEIGIACTGISGIWMSSIIVEKTNRKLLVVRRNLDNTHSYNQLEGYQLRKYVIIDDFVETGETIDFIINTIAEYNKKSICVGIILYDSIGYDEKKLKFTNYKKEINVYCCKT